MLIYPDWLDPADWKDFIDFRREKRKPLTPGGQKRMLNRLADFVSQGHNAAKMLDQSIRNGWTDVYPAKDEKAETALDTVERVLSDAAPTDQDWISEVESPVVGQLTGGGQHG